MSTPREAVLTLEETRAFEAARILFPGALSQAYIDVASRGLLPEDAPQLAYDHLKQRVLGVADKHAYFDVVERARNGIATLLNAQPEEIAITKNISDGLNMVANAMDWREGDEVFLCSDIEHPSNLYTWRNLESLGVKLRDFRTCDDEFPVDAVIQALRDSRSARVVAVSATSFVPGYRVDLDRLGAACRLAGVRLVVDGAQSVGITHIDLERTPVDAFAMSTQKGLCSVYGMGFLYVRREFAEQLKPRYLARFGVNIPATHEADYDSSPLKFKPGALRFDLGNYNFLAATLVTRTLDLLNGLGTQAIDRHVSNLAQHLAIGLSAIDAPVRVPKPGHGTNIVCVESRMGQAPAEALQKYLRECGVQAAVRRNVVRFSFHLYNNTDDMMAALSACANWLKENRRSLG